MRKLSDTFTDEQIGKYPHYYRFCIYDDDLAFARWLLDESGYELGTWEFDDPERASPNFIPKNISPEMLICQYLDEDYHEVMREREAMLNELLDVIRRAPLTTASS